MFTKVTKHITSLVLIVLTFSGCSTYYQKTQSAERALVSKNYENAEKIIIKNKFLSRKRNTLLYYLELGKMEHLQGKFEESNKHLNLADDLIESYRNLFDMALGATVNPAMQSYRAEGHERILIHYYKALNYLQLNQMEDAIVEARRIDLNQTQAEADASGKWKKYGKDPFGLILMGMIYEADHDYNNAFIAYRNAKEAFEKDETGIYKNQFPHTLEQDLARTSKYAGMNYATKQIVQPLNHGEAIIFWENGLAPIKEEKNLFFSLNKKDGKYFFVADNLVIPANYNFEEKDKDFKPSDIGILRIAWSKYMERPTQNKSAQITVNGQKQGQFQIIEDVSALAFQIERDNYFKELAKNLVRLTIKKVTELSLSQQNEYAGLALGLVNAASEKADTRNWQSLPSQIHYTRIPLQEGMNSIKITCGNGEIFEYNINGNGRTIFRNVITY